MEEAGKKNVENYLDLTIEKLKTFPGFETVSNAEAENIIQTIKQFTLIAYHCFEKEMKDEKFSQAA